MAETFYLGLRTREGVSDADFCRKFGESIADVFGTALRRHPTISRITRTAGNSDLEGWLIFDHLILPFL